MGRYERPPMCLRCACVADRGTLAAHDGYCSRRCQSRAASAEILAWICAAVVVGLVGYVILAAVTSW